MSSYGANFSKITASFLLLMVVCYFWVDRPTELYLSQHLHHTWASDLAQFVAVYLTSTNMTLVAAVCFLIFCYQWLRKRPQQAFPYGFIAISYAIAYLAASFLKFLLARYRPVMYIHDHLYGFHFLSTQHNFTSFPSGHTIASAVLAFAACCFIKPFWARALLILYALIVGISRLISVAHYPSDVLASYYLATIIVYSLHYYYSAKMVDQRKFSH